MPWHVVHGSTRHLSCVLFLLQFVPRAATVRTAQSRVDTARTTLPVTSSVERVTAVTKAFSRHCASQVVIMLYLFFEILLLVLAHSGIIQIWTRLNKRCLHTKLLLAFSRWAGEVCG